MCILTEVRFSQAEIFEMIQKHLVDKYGWNVQADQIIAMCDDLENSSNNFEVWAQVNVVELKS